MNSMSHAKTQRRKSSLFVGSTTNRKLFSIGIGSLFTKTLYLLFFAPLRLCVRNKAFLLAPTFLLLTACGEPATGPVDVVWDRDNCDRCVMALSDRFHSAQVRGGDRHQAYHFDDLGCALLWLEEQPWKDDPKTEIWVNDHRDGSWLNARTAHYLKLTHTPMNYGFSAQPEAGEGSIDFNRAREAVFQQEAAYQASVEARLKHRREEAARSNPQ